MTRISKTKIKTSHRAEAHGKQFSLNNVKVNKTTAKKKRGHQI